MQSWRLKNIIILILALVNVFLLGSLLLRKSEDDSARRRAATELTALFAADGVMLHPDALAVDPAPEGRSLSRSVDEDRSMAVFLLGNDATASDKGGGITAYHSHSGEALFRVSGGFEATGTLSGGADPETWIRRFCRQFNYDDLVLSLENGSGTAVAIQHYNGFSVANCAVTFTLLEGEVSALSGTHLPETYTAMAPTIPLSALTALTSFLEYRRNSGAVVSSVTDMVACYELQSTTAAPMTLVPVWQVVTGAGNYYVNSFTGIVAHS